MAAFSTASMARHAIAFCARRSLVEVEEVEEVAEDADMGIRAAKRGGALAAGVYHGAFEKAAAPHSDGVAVRRTARRRSTAARCSANVRLKW